MSLRQPNARGSADCGWARQVTLYTNFASKKYLKNRAVAIRLQRPLPAVAVFPHRRNWQADLTGLLSCPLAEAKNKTDTSPDGDPFAVCLALQRGSGFRVISPLVASLSRPRSGSYFYRGEAGWRQPIFNPSGDDHEQKQRSSKSR
jgi:hypothetical protein